MFTLEEKYKCLLRELALRKAVYPKWIAQKKMTEQKANFEIGVLEAIVADYALLMPKVH